MPEVRPLRRLQIDKDMIQYKYKKLSEEGRKDCEAAMVRDYQTAIDGGADKRAAIAAVADKYGCAPITARKMLRKELGCEALGIRQRARNGIK